MRITTNQGEYFVSLPARLFLDLKLICEKDSSISLDLAVLLTHQILNLKYADKNFKEGKEWVHLNAGILRTNYDTKGFTCKNHLEFLVESGIIEMKSHYHDPNGENGYSRSYRIHQKYFTDNKDGRTIFDSVFEIVPVSEPRLKRKFLKRIQKRKRQADLSAKHLTQWLNDDKFEFDIDTAIKYVDTVYPKSASEKMRRRNMKRMFFIKNFETALQIYSMEGKDGRLHTCFTYLPSDLKQFVKYEGKELKEADIKSSQPFILTVLLELIINAYKEEIDRKGYITVQHFTKKLMRLLTKYTNTNINNFINLYN
ncbi:MAG: hypothetical protein KDC67_13655, partial [Ignavibacteriae bacterium]|nr:hypothetical protein [Ignavibacteriota bacterium]